MCFQNLACSGWLLHIAYTTFNLIIQPKECMQTCWLLSLSIGLDEGELLHNKDRSKRDTEPKGTLALSPTTLPRIPNPIGCLSSGDMLVFQLTINHTGRLLSSLILKVVAGNIGDLQTERMEQ